MNTNPAITVNELNTKSIDELFQLAEDENTPVEILIELTKTRNAKKIQHAVSLNSQLPAETLATLATRKDVAVRQGVAMNLSSSNDTLAKLATDEDYVVRGAVANNASTQVEVLESLKNDVNGNVRWLAEKALANQKG